MYFCSLLIVSVVFWHYAMPFLYFVMGIVWVTAFFLLLVKWSKEWRVRSRRQFISNLFVLAFVLRIVWVFVSYFYYQAMTGTPFELEAADSIGYHEEANWLAHSSWSMTWEYYLAMAQIQVSDIGYPFYLSLLYRLFGTNVIIPRCLKALLSAFTCYLLYLMAARNFGEEARRIAGIICALMPNFIIYCGYHLKETEMLFLEVAFLERADFLFRNKKKNVWTILVPTLLAGSLFFFRTVL